jgi:hypothetical protein
MVSNNTIIMKDVLDMCLSVSSSSNFPVQNKGNYKIVSHDSHTSSRVLKLEPPKHVEWFLPN